MSNTGWIKFKGEIEKYLRNSNHNFESKIDEAFSDLKVKTLLCRANIIKKEGYHCAHLLFTLIILPLLKVNTIRGFCQKHWQHWSTARKDTLYRFKKNPNYRWRSFMCKINLQIFKAIKLDKIPLKERYFVIDF